MRHSKILRGLCTTLTLSSLVLTGCASNVTHQNVSNQSDLPSATSASATPSEEPAVPRHDRKGGPVDCTIDKCVALTFDDGPGDFTQGIIDTLNKKDAKATFFMLGQSAQYRPETVKYVHDHGMEIGEHTWDHQYLTTLDAKTQINEITETKNLLEGIIGGPIVGTRPPYGDFNRSTETGDTPFILWSVDSLDYQEKGVDVTLNNIMTGVQPGAIILMHDIHKQSAEALPQIIDALHRRGYEIVTVSQLFPQPLTKNYVYYSAEYAEFGSDSGATETTDTTATAEPSAESPAHPTP